MFPNSFHTYNWCPPSIVSWEVFPVVYPVLNFGNPLQQNPSVPRFCSQPQPSHQCKFPKCQKMFFEFSALKKHELEHDERKYMCSVQGCGRKFIDNSKLKRHMLVHTGEKPHQCEVCGKRFSLDFNLKTHKRIHTGEKPYQCSFEGCLKRFTQSSNLVAHEKTHYQKKRKRAMFH